MASVNTELYPHWLLPVSLRNESRRGVGNWSIQHLATCCYSHFTVHFHHERHKTAVNIWECREYTEMLSCTCKHWLQTMKYFIQYSSYNLLSTIHCQSVLRKEYCWGRRRIEGMKLIKLFLARAVYLPHVDISWQYFHWWGYLIWPLPLPSPISTSSVSYQGRRVTHLVYFVHCLTLFSNLADNCQSVAGVNGSTCVDVCVWLFEIFSPLMLS